MLNKPVSLFLSSVLILTLATPLLAAGEEIEVSKDDAVKVETNTKTITEVKDGKKIMTRIARFTVRRSAPYIQDFNVKDYKSALQSDKLIVLLFYTQDSKLSMEEYQYMKEAFKNLKVKDVVAFRVDYQDKKSDQSENNLAKAFKVNEAGTKIFIKNGGKILQTADSWIEQDYITNITAVQKK